MTGSLSALATPRLASGAGRRFLLPPALPLVVGAFVLLKMFYVFPSGSPQPADLLFAPLGLIVLLPYASEALARRGAIVLALVGWIVAVNAAWYFRSGEPEFITSSAYYAYNALVFFAALAAYRAHPDALSRLLRAAVLVALACGAILVVSTTSFGRHTGSFANPNQLGYWSLLLVAIYGIVSYRRPVGPADVVVLLLGLFVCAMSLSIAAISAYALLILTFGIAHPAPRWLRATMVWILVVAGLLLIWEGTALVRAGDLWTGSLLESRVAEVFERGIGELSYRGYDRLVAYPEFTLIGAGEGALDRFAEDLEIELHSSFGTMAFAYGALGFTLFAGLLVHALRGAPWIVVLYVIPVLLYGLAHQGLRFSWFWIVLGVASAIAEQRASLGGPSSAAGVTNPHRRDGSAQTAELPATARL